MDLKLLSFLLYQTITMLTKSLIYLLVCATFALASETIRLQSWNLRFDKVKDGIPVEDTIKSLEWGIPADGGPFYENYGEETWSKRRIAIANDVVFNRADIFSVNEALKRQVDDLEYLLNKMSGQTWRHVGVGRDDGKEKGEYSAIFYNANKIHLWDSDQVWLSDTPFEPSKYPGAGSYRLATIAHMSTWGGGFFTLINTHLDDRSDDQRKLGASLLKQIGAHEYSYSLGPVFLTGDFNSQANGSASGAYRIVTGLEEAVPINETFAKRYHSPIADTFTFGDFLPETDPLQRSGHFATWDGFKPWGDTSAIGDRIDFQFVGKPNKEAWNIPKKQHKIERYRTGETFWDLQFHMSDHRPVISDITLSWL